MTADSERAAAIAALAAEQASIIYAALEKYIANDASGKCPHCGAGPGLTYGHPGIVHKPGGLRGSIPGSGLYYQAGCPVPEARKLMAEIEETWQGGEEGEEEAPEFATEA